MSNLRDEVIVCGRLPRKLDGSVDLYKVDRLLKACDDTNHRIAVMRRLLDCDVARHRVEALSAIDANFGVFADPDALRAARAS